MKSDLWAKVHSASRYKKEFLRYLLTGCTIFALDLAVWLFCVSVLGWDIRSSQVLSRTVGAIAGFFGHKYFSFRSPGEGRHASIFTQGGSYTAITILNIVISPWIVYGSVTLLYGMPGALVAGKILAEVVLVLETYLLLRIVFLPRRSA